MQGMGNTRALYRRDESVRFSLFLVGDGVVGYLRYWSSVALISVGEGWCITTVGGGSFLSFFLFVGNNMSFILIHPKTRQKGEFNSYI